MGGVAIRALPGIAMLPMGFVTFLRNGPNPKIVLAIDFQGPFLRYFLFALFLLCL